MIGTLDELESYGFVKNEQDKTVDQVFITPNFYNIKDSDAQNKITNLQQQLDLVVDNPSDAMDSLSETVSAIQDLQTWKGKIDKLTVSHINHNSTVTGDDYNTFVASANGVTMHYDCFSLSSGGGTSHDNIAFPVASTTQAGIVTAADYQKIAGIEDNEEVVAAALTDLDSRILALVARVEALETALNNQ